MDAIKRAYGQKNEAVDEGAVIGEWGQSHAVDSFWRARMYAPCVRMKKLL